eukprot:g7361.t1
MSGVEPNPVRFQVGDGTIIKGIDEGVRGMREGPAGAGAPLARCPPKALAALSELHALALGRALVEDLPGSLPGGAQSGALPGEMLRLRSRGLLSPQPSWTGPLHLGVALVLPLHGAMTRVAAVADHAPGHAQSSPSREERLLELCLGSPSAWLVSNEHTGARRPRPSSAPAQRRARQDATCGRKERELRDGQDRWTERSKTSKRPTSACGVCGRPAAKKGLDLPLEWMRIYREPSNPKLGWCQKSQKGRPDAENAPKFRSSLGRRSSRIFQTQSEVDWLVEAWQKRVLACGRSLRLRQKSLVNFVDQVLAAGVSSPKGSGLSDTLKFEEDLDLEDFGGPSLVHAPITASRGSVRSVRASILKPACPQEAKRDGASSAARLDSEGGSAAGAADARAGSAASANGTAKGSLTTVISSALDYKRFLDRRKQMIQQQVESAQQADNQQKTEACL